MTSSGLSGPDSSSSRSAAAAVGSPADSRRFRAASSSSSSSGAATAATPAGRRDELAGLFHGGDGRDDLVDRLPDGLEARGRQMREVGGRAWRARPRIA